MATVIAIANQKGGVGKTTTTFNLAAALAERGERVLLIDMDAAGDLSYNIADVDPDSSEFTIYEVLLGEVDLQQAIVRTSIENISVVPATPDLSGAEIELIQEKDWRHALARAIAPLNNQYDFILVDSPPSLGILSTSTLVASNLVVVPVEAEYLSLRGVKRLMQIIEDLQTNLGTAMTFRILCTKHDRRTLHTGEIIEELRDIFGKQVYETVIPRTIRFADAAGHNQPLVIYDERSPGAEAYRKLIEEVSADYA